MKQLHSPCVRKSLSHGGIFGFCPSLPCQRGGAGECRFFEKGHKVNNYFCQRWKSLHGWDLLSPGGKHYLRTLDPAERNAVWFLSEIDLIEIRCVGFDFIVVRTYSLLLFRRLSANFLFVCILLASVFDAVPTAFSHPVICLIAVGLSPGNTIEFCVLALACPPWIPYEDACIRLRLYLKTCTIKDRGNLQIIVSILFLLGTI